jgi:hypothetical protein
MSRADFDVLLDRYFIADDATEADRGRLYAAAMAALRDPAMRAGLLAGLRSAGTVAGGLAWWEELRAERGRGEGGDRASILLLLTSDPALDPRPRPRPYCPPPYVGSWRGDDGRAWTLDRDGALTGDPDRPGWTWRIRGGPLPHLCLGPPTAPLREQWLVQRLDGDEMDLVPPGASRGHRTWRRSG